MQINPYRIPNDAHRVEDQPLNVRPHQIPELFVPHEHHADEEALPGMTIV